MKTHRWWIVLAAVAWSGCGDAPAPPDPAPEALRALATAMSRGGGMDDASWPELVQRAGLTLWPGTGAEDGAALAARKAHAELAYIAGDLARSFATGPAEREAWTERDPESVAIHDAFVAAAGKGAVAYRTWVEGEGASLMRRRMERLTAPPR